MRAEYAERWGLWIRRRDTVRQAVSSVRARGSGAYSWEVGTPRANAGDLRFDFEEIERHVRLYAEWDAGWRDYFSALGIRPERVVYEDDLEHDLARTTRRILELVEVDVPAELAIWSPFQKQSDKLSEELVRRYVAEAAHRPAGADRPAVARTGGPEQHHRGS